jgi:tetratricopeptide (TPR) repeat protein
LDCLRFHSQGRQELSLRRPASNPALVEPRIYMANLFTDTGKVEEAVPLPRSVLQDSPNNAEAHWELGYAYRFAGMLKESVAECDEYYINRRDQAARDFDSAFERNSSVFPVKVGKALSYSIKRDDARGLKLLAQTEDKVEELGVSDAEDIYKLAQAYAVLGDRVSALHICKPHRPRSAQGVVAKIDTVSWIVRPRNAALL